MTISGPTLVSCSALPTESIVVKVGSDTFVLVAKAHQGSGFPRRELELFKLSDILAAQSGTFFLNVYPQQVKALQDNFYQISAVTTSGNTIRLYYNTPAISGGASTIFTRDIDAVTLQSVSSRNQLAFDGMDPFIMDARVGSGSHANRLYLVYVGPSGTLLARQSFDLGTTWGTVITVEDQAPLVRQVEANITDPTGAKENVQVLMQRDT